MAREVAREVAKQICNIKDKNGIVYYIIRDSRAEPVLKKWGKSNTL